MFITTARKVVWNRELAKTTLNIVAFATSHREELLVVDYASGIYRLVESPPDDSHRRFPRQLSETGLFASVADHRPAPGVVPYVVTAPGWTDGAVAERLVALPGDSRIERKVAASPIVEIPRRRGARSNSFAPAASWRPGYRDDGLRRGC